MRMQPAWLATLERCIQKRFAAQSWTVPLVLRVSDGDRHWCIQLPDGGGAPADIRPLRIASVTKVYVAAGLFRLQEQGRLNLQAPLAKVIGVETAALLARGGYDPRSITVDQVMRHTSGLGDHCFSDRFLDRVKAAPGHRWTRAEQIAIAMDEGAPTGLAGSGFAYSDTGYVILGEVVERAFEGPLPTALAELLGYDALGLEDTVWDHSDRDPHTLERQYLGEHESTQWDASFDLFGGGGIVATLADIDKFLRALLGGRVFEADATMQRIASDRDTPSDPGFVHNGLMFRGIISGEDVWAHTGFWGVQAAILPMRGLVLAAAFNRAPEDGVYGKDDLLVDFAQAVADSAR